MSAHEETNTAIETVTPATGDVTATPEGAAAAEPNAQALETTKDASAIPSSLESTN
jgi:hypothetical protein